MHKKKSAVVHHRRWFSADGLPPPSELFPSQMYYPCTFCTCAKYKSAVVHHRRRPACLRRLNYSLLRCTTHVPFVLVQNTSQRSYTIDDGSPLTACLRRLNYSLLRCTTHVPFVLVHKKKSAVVHHRRWFSADCYLFPSQKVLPMYLLYLCIKKSQRSYTIGDGSPLTVIYSLLRKYYPCTFCTCA